MENVFDPNKITVYKLVQCTDPFHDQTDPLCPACLQMLKHVPCPTCGGPRKRPHVTWNER